MSNCYKHGIEYAGNSCPRCASEEQHRELMGIQTQNARNLERHIEHQDRTNLVLAGVMQALGHTIDKVTDKVVFLEDKFDRYVKEETMKTEEVLVFGQAGGPLGPGKSCIERYELLPNGQLHLEHINPFISNRLQPPFEEGIAQFKTQFQGPGLAYIQTQIETCAALGFTQNKELGELPKWLFDGEVLSINYYQHGKVFTLYVHFQHLNNTGEMPFQAPLKTHYLDLATLSVGKVDELKDHPLFSISVTDGTVALDVRIVADICETLVADFHLPFRKGLDRYTSSLNQEAIRQKRFEAVTILKKALQQVWDAQQEAKRAERQRVEADIKLRKKLAIGLAIAVLIGMYFYFTSLGYRTSKYYIPGDFHEGLAKVRLNVSYGFIDTKGVEVYHCKYEIVEDFAEGLAKVQLNDKIGFIDKTGRVVIPLKYDWVDNFAEGLAKVRLNDKMGFINTKGVEVVPCKYDEIGPFREGFAKVQLNDEEGGSLQGLINKTGREVVPVKYYWVDNFAEGLAVVKLEPFEGCGFVDKTGRVVIPLKYKDADSFQEGLALVRLNDKMGYIDKTGRVVIPLKYESGSFNKGFKEGLARVSLDGKYGFIDKTGNEYWFEESRYGPIQISEEEARRQMKNR